MDLGLKSKKALVMASSQGLGKAVALEFAKEGVDLVICGRNADTLEMALEEIQAAGAVEVLAVKADLTDARSRDELLRAAQEKFGRIDILVTNTGGPPPGNFDDTNQEDWDRTYELLLGSAVAVIRGVLPGMKENGWGRIIAITSQAVKQPVDQLILSNAVRTSLAGLTKSLANELGPYNITVNNVMPGYTKTNRLLSLIEKNPAIQKAADTIPLGRFADPEEFAAAVAFLASKRAGYITGTSLPVDGGWIKSVL
jgi:3-oxoacyl-[acyl-carrier protein] reductase